MAWTLVFFSLLSLLCACAQQQCGKDVGAKVCDGGLCCSQDGYCGTTSDYCGTGCQSQCIGSGGGSGGGDGGGGGDLGSLLPQSTFEAMLKHRNDANCPAKGFYTYNAFVAAANAFGEFATVGDTNTRKREIAAFFAQTSQATTGGWSSAPDGPYTWGYCFLQEQGNPPDYCVASAQWPCAPGKKYYGRGPIQISFNYNYGPAGKAIGFDGIADPDRVSTDATVSFKAALWFWMTPQSPKPSCHDVMTGKWSPSDSDKAAGRLPGLGVVTNIVNGIECGKGADDRVAGRIGFYKRYCDMLGVSYGDNLDCYNQRPFG